MTRLYTHGFWVINIPGSRLAEGGNFRLIHLERSSGHTSEEWAFSITWYWFQEKWIWPCSSRFTVMRVPQQWAVLSVAAPCGWRSERHPSIPAGPSWRVMDFALHMAALPSSPHSSKGNAQLSGFFAEMVKCQTQNFFPSLFKWCLALS